MTVTYSRRPHCLSLSRASRCQLLATTYTDCKSFLHVETTTCTVNAASTYHGKSCTNIRDSSKSVAFTRCLVRKDITTLQSGWHRFQMNTHFATIQWNNSCMLLWQLLVLILAIIHVENKSSNFTINNLVGYDT